MIPVAFVHVNRNCDVKEERKNEKKRKEGRKVSQNLSSLSHHCTARATFKLSAQKKHYKMQQKHSPLFNSACSITFMTYCVWEFIRNSFLKFP